MKSKIWNLINESDSILLLTHENPDGDAIGSLMAFYYALTDMGKKVTAIIPERPPVYDYLSRIDEVCIKSNDKFDLAIVTDCANLERVAQTNNEFSKCKNTVVIDHHMSNGMYGDVNYVDGDISSCSQMLYYLFKSWNIEITKDIGEALVTGMLTHTNGYSNDNVDKATFLMSAELIEKGIDIHRIYYLALNKRNMAQYLLSKITIDNMEFLEDGKIAFSYITHDDYVKCNAQKGDHEGLVNIGRNVEGVEVSIFVREEENFNVSLRSSGKINVNNIANRLGGGGHAKAAGIKLSGSLEETRELLINETIKELRANEWNSDNKQKIRIHE